MFGGSIACRTSKDFATRFCVVTRGAETMISASGHCSSAAWIRVTRGQRRRRFHACFHMRAPFACPGRCLQSGVSERTARVMAGSALVAFMAGLSAMGSQQYPKSSPRLTGGPTPVIRANTVPAGDRQALNELTTAIETVAALESRLEFSHAALLPPTSTNCGRRRKLPEKRAIPTPKFLPVRRRLRPRVPWRSSFCAIFPFMRRFRKAPRQVPEPGPWLQAIQTCCSKR